MRPFRGYAVSAPVGDTRRVRQWDFQFEGPVVEWPGPAPLFFVAIPAEESVDIKFAAKGLEYSGQVPVVVRVGEIEFTTALVPRDRSYLLPLRDGVRISAGIELDQVVSVRLSVGRH